MTPLLILLVAYSGGLIVLGAWISRRVRITDDFFVGGRSLGAGLIFATFLAPNIGAGSTVGATDLAYREGWSAWWWNGSAGLGSLVLAFWIGPRIWREAKRLNLLTVGDFLEHRYGRGVRGLTAALIWIGTLFVLCAQLNGIAVVLRIAGGVPPPLGRLIGALVMTAYFVGGGLAGAARVNAIQLTVKLVGFGLATPLAIAAAGGWHAVATGDAGGLALWHVSPKGEGWPLLFLTGPAFFLSPGLLQKAFSAKDERALTRGVAGNGIALMIFAAIPVTLGLSARTLFPHLARDTALPAILAAVPIGVGGLALAAVFSAELSAADAVLFMLSTSGARDFYKGILRPDAADAEVLRAARVAALFGGALGYSLTFAFGTVLVALALFYSVLVVGLFVPILGGLYLPWAGRRGAVASILAGVTVLVATQIVTDGRGYHGWVSPTLMGLAGSCAAFLAFARRKNGLRP
jgi:SSS family solute:Na+ symporter